MQKSGQTHLLQSFQETVSGGYLTFGVKYPLPFISIVSLLKIVLNQYYIFKEGQKHGREYLHTHRLAIVVKVSETVDCVLLLLVYYVEILLGHLYARMTH